MIQRFIPAKLVGRRTLPSHWDVVAALIILSAMVLLAQASREVAEPLATLARTPLSLDPAALPHYALRTTLRMLAALMLSLVFTFTYATLAAKSKRAELLLVPMLDILQSVPILGFISVTVVFFMSLAPGRVFGAELAAVFAIFTSQAWNMAFSFYQSLRTVPVELTEAARNFGLTAWTRFWRVEVPFALPQLIWNMMMSMSGGWFFVVASEAISVGHTTIALPGMGAYIALAIERQDLHAILAAIGVMLLVIFIYDQLLFRPLVAYAERFRFEQSPGAAPPRSWLLDVLRRSRLVALAAAPLGHVWRRTYRLRLGPAPAPAQTNERTERWIALAWGAFLLIAIGVGVRAVLGMILTSLPLREVGTTLLLGFATLARVLILIVLASAIWVPVGVYLGMRPKIARLAQPVAQFLAAFPANLLFPIAVSAIIALKLNPDVWLSPLMILGTQWYILFNVIAGASAIPSEFHDISMNLQVGGLLWWRRVALPAVLPYYLTGAITASGGSWNASIVAEVASWGSTTLRAHGLGAYIADATAAGDFPRIVLGIAVMSLFVVVLNRAFWRPLYWYAERKFRLG